MKTVFLLLCTVMAAVLCFSTLAGAESMNWDSRITQAIWNNALQGANVLPDTSSIGTSTSHIKNSRLDMGSSSGDSTRQKYGRESILSDHSAVGAYQEFFEARGYNPNSASDVYRSQRINNSDSNFVTYAAAGAASDGDLARPFAGQPNAYTDRTVIQVQTTDAGNRIIRAAPNDLNFRVSSLDTSHWFNLQQWSSPPFAYMPPSILLLGVGLVRLAALRKRMRK